MEQFVGLAVSQKLTQVCVIDVSGEIVWQGKCASTPEALAKVVTERAPEATRIGLESGMLSAWLWHALAGMNLPVVCLDARHARATPGMQGNMTDGNDAFGLAQIVRSGLYREAGVKSFESQVARSAVGARAQLIGMRQEIANHIRGVLKTFGIVLERKGRTAFEQQVEQVARGDGMFSETLRSLLAVLRSVREQLKVLDRRLRDYAREHAVCRRLMTIPGIGALTAIAFVAGVDDPGKFRNSKSVAAYFGLAPRRNLPGESGQPGREGLISKRGDALVRTYLFEAAGVLLTCVKKESALQAWGLQVAQRAGFKKAKVAVARKLAVLMHRMWVAETDFRWSDPATATQRT
jgi:transposase